MKSEEVAAYLRDHYSREDNLLLTLISCSLIMETEQAKQELSPPIKMVAETLKVLRESLNEQELSTVSMLLAEIQRLADGD